MKLSKPHLPILVAIAVVSAGLACNTLLPLEALPDTIVTPAPAEVAPPETPSEIPPVDAAPIDALPPLPDTLQEPLSPQELAALAPIDPGNAAGLVPLLSFEPGEVVDFSWHPSGGFVAFATRDLPYVAVWNTFIVEQVAELGDLFQPVHGVSLSRFDDTVLVADDSEVALLDFASGEHLQTVDIPAFPINELELSPDGFNAAIGYGGPGGEIGLFRLEEGESIGFYAHEDWVTDLAFSPSGQLLATAAANGTIKVIDAAATQTEVHNLTHGEWVDSLALTFAPFEMDLIGHILASSASGEIKLWDVTVPGGEVWAVAAAHPSDITSLAFAPEGYLLASGDVDGNIKLWDTLNGSELASFPAHSGEIVELAFSPDGRLLGSASLDGTFRMWAPGVGLAP